MAGAATIPAQKRGAATESKQTQILVPFTRGAFEHHEIMDDRTVQLTASATLVGPIDIPAYGFMRDIFLNVTASGGAGNSTVAVTEDAPWNLFDEITVMDINSQPLVGPINGYDAYLINKYGGYDRHSPDPKQDPSYSAPAVGASASGNFQFQLRIPIEICARDALGALANANSASTYKLRYTLAPSSRIYSTAPNTTLPSVRVVATLNAWTQPAPTDLRGNPQAPTPPAHGTLQFWSAQTFNIAAGQNTIKLPRVGNYFRMHIIQWRNASGQRIAAMNDWPDPFTVAWDTRVLVQDRRDLFRNQMKKRYDFASTADTARGLESGVWVQEYAHDFDGLVGHELRDGWIPTSQATRWEFTGVWANSGVLRVLTNDVAPQGDIYTA